MAYYGPFWDIPRHIPKYNPGTAPGFYWGTCESWDTWTWGVCVYVSTILEQSRSVVRYLGIPGYLDMGCMRVCVYHSERVPGLYLGTWETRDTWTWGPFIPWSPTHICKDVDNTDKDLSNNPLNRFPIVNTIGSIFKRVQEVPRISCVHISSGNFHPKTKFCGCLMFTERRPTLPKTLNCDVIVLLVDLWPQAIQFTDCNLKTILQSLQQYKGYPPIGITKEWF